MALEKFLLQTPFSHTETDGVSRRLSTLEFKFVTAAVVKLLKEATHKEVQTKCMTLLVENTENLKKYSCNNAI